MLISLIEVINGVIKKVNQNIDKIDFDAYGCHWICVYSLKDNYDLFVGLVDEWVDKLYFC